MRRPITVHGLVGALALLAVLAGCAPSGIAPVTAPTGSPPPPSPSPSAADSPSATDSPSAIETLAVDVYRTRSDPASGRIQISVENRSETAITVVRAELASPALADALARDGDTVIPPGARRDLPVTLTPPLCPADDASLVATITLEQPDGERTSTTLEATDRLGQWSDWLTAECFTVAVLERVELSLERAPERDDLAGGVEASIGLTLVVRGRDGGDAPLTLGTISGTPLLTPMATSGGGTTDSSTVRGPGDGDNTTGTTAPESGATTRIPIDVAPARCDPHAIAEDKQGTLFPLAVTLGGDSGRVIVAASDEVRAELYAAITSACAEGAAAEADERTTRAHSGPPGTRNPLMMQDWA